MVLGFNADELAPDRPGEGSERVRAGAPRCPRRRSPREHPPGHRFAPRRWSPSRPSMRPRERVADGATSGPRPGRRRAPPAGTRRRHRGEPIDGAQRLGDAAGIPRAAHPSGASTPEASALVGEAPARSPQTARQPPADDPSGARRGRPRRARTVDGSGNGCSDGVNTPPHDAPAGAPGRDSAATSPERSRTTPAPPSNALRRSVRAVLRELFAVDVPRSPSQAPRRR